MAGGPTAIDIAREYFPKLSKDDLNYIVWNHTGYPVFWDYKNDDETAESCLRRHLQRFKENDCPCPECNMVAA